MLLILLQSSLLFSHFGTFLLQSITSYGREKPTKLNRVEVVCFLKEEISPAPQCIMDFPSLIDRRNDIGVTMRNGAAWLDESGKNNQVPC